MSIPKAFISYSHDTQEHKRWVLELATPLRNNGIDAIIDQYELQPGDDIPHFMETHLESADKIIMVCTERYVEKANAGTGGVGYEKMIVTSSLMQRIDQNKVIPIIRQTGGNLVPTFLKSKLYINFSKNEDYEYSYDELVRTIHGSPLFQKPPIGNNPFQPIEKTKLDGGGELVNSVIKALLKGHYEVGAENSSRQFIASEANVSLGLADIGIIKSIQLGYVRWYFQGLSVAITEKGKLYAYENGLIK